MSEENKNRLPTNVVPKAYRLVIDLSDLELRETTSEDGKLDIEQNPYSGTVEIEIEITESTRTIVLNANKVTVTDASFTGDGGPLDVLAIDVDEENERVTIILDDVAPNGKATLTLEFTSVLATPTEGGGLYQSVFELNGKKRLMATTQFEPTDARRCFPCFDEPALKATFHVTVTVPEDRTVLSNTDPVTIFDNSDGTKTVVFDTTPKMSTYLLAFIVGDLASIETETERGTIVRVWAVPDRLNMATFSLGLARDTLEFLENYFEIPYPLAKIDNVAIPDFSAGAMENWGIVTYREYGLLVPENASINMKKWATGVIPHELVHQWFGNFVTMCWWDNLWLNEAFATFVGDLCVDALFPEWNWWDEFVAGDTVRGMNLDSLHNSHPIEVPVEDARQINEIFDAISYSKGASVLRMLHEYVGAETFRQGVVAYLKAHAYGNTVTADLLMAIENVSGKPVVESFTTWIEQIGHPVVTVERSGRQLTLTQERFLLEQGATDDLEFDGAIWPITVQIYEAGTEDIQTVQLDGGTTTVQLDEIGSLVLVNPGRFGFYRVDYDSEPFGAIRDAIASGVVPVIDQVGIFDDAYMLMRAGYLQVDQYLELVDAARNETNFLVWGEILGGLSAVADIFVDDPSLPALKTWARHLIAPLVEELGWAPMEGEEEGVTRLRPIVLSAAARFEDADVAETAVAHLSDNSETIHRFVEETPADLRGTILSIAMQGGDTETLAMLTRLQQEAVAASAELPPDLQMTLLRGIGSAKDEDVLREALAYALSDSVRGNDAFIVFYGVGVEQKRVAWDFLVDNWEIVFERYGDDRKIGAFIGAAAGGTASATFADEVEAFFDANPTPAATRVIAQLLEATRLRASFLEQNSDALTEWANPPSTHVGDLGGG